MTDIIIIGGGIIGLMTARELVATGAKIIILEKEMIGRESSWAGGGILSPLYPWRTAEPIIQLWLRSHAEYPQLAETLQRHTGIDPEWQRSGLLIGDCENPSLIETWCKSHGIAYERLSFTRFRELEPSVSLTPSSPLFLSEIAQVRNPRLLRACQSDLLAQGAQILEHRPVTEVGMDGRRRIRRVRAGNETFTADQFVITAGAWSGAVSRHLFPLPHPSIEPVKGQMIVFSAEPDLLRHMVLHQGHYLIPRKDGKILAGSTLEYTGFDKATTESARDELLEFAYAALPALRSYPIEKHWAGLRPGTPTGIPYIGRHPEIQNLYFNCGHFRNGFATAPASARLLSDLLLDRPPDIFPEPYSLTVEH
ncbi:glycine oxidase ThiO [Methylocaldum szegediense]|uniref:Glycine oxidase n=1 Tax=Methylocaldum szegediense TaxID=73780 RepID=A0ABN8XCB3_9GAMM|nr:glycine oxidase ThiO [Methylocaldum szegediense]CAI8958555.1 Glycine oxidase [Methylocaldum szegediense]